MMTVMASGLFALLDDIAAIAKVAAASIDDAAAQAVKVGTKAAGIVIDDAAVTPRYVVGFAADRELPIIGKIAWGSLKNKLLYLLPGALALSYFAPWAITPLLMAGGAFLCFEGYEKVHEMLHPSAAAPGAGAATAAAAPAGDARSLEDAKVTSAIRTDFILSAEIMALSLAAVTAPGFVNKAIVLGMVGLLVTVAVYGAVALIVKADDFGVYLAKNASTGTVRAMGRGIVAGMPGFLKVLSIIGMLAMLWVGGGIILHGLEDFGLGVIPHMIHALAKGIGAIFGPLSGLIAWLIDASVAGIIGLGIGWGVVKGMERMGFGH
jgi:uncharacterized protein